MPVGLVGSELHQVTQRLYECHARLAHHRVVGFKVPLEVGAKRAQVMAKQLGTRVRLAQIECRPHPGLQLHRAERLGQKVVGAVEQQTAHFVRRGNSRHHQDASVRAVCRLSQLGQQFRAGHPRHDDIQQNQAEPTGVDELQRFLGVVRHFTLRLFVLNDGLAQTQNRRIVVDDKHALHVRNGFVGF